MIGSLALTGTDVFRRLWLLAMISLLAIFLLTSSVPAHADDPDEGELWLESPVPEISGGGAMAGMGTDAPLTSPTVELNSAPFPTPSIESFTYDDNIIETTKVFVPPDPIAAAGPSNLVAVVNTMIEWRLKDGTLQFRDSLRDFFAPLSPKTFTFDPKVIYDQYANRFVVVTLERVNANPEANPSPGNESRILMAVSDDSDPNGTWHFQAINSKTLINNVEYWADYPGLAVDDEAVYITNNMFAFPDAESVFNMRLWIVDKGLGSGGFYDGGAASSTVHDPFESEISITVVMQPAHVFGAAPQGVGTFLAGYNGVSTGGTGGVEGVQVIRVDDPISNPTFTHQFVNVGDIENIGDEFGGIPALPDAPQLGSATAIEVNDRRTLNAVWRDNSLWVTSTIIPNSGPDAGQTTAHWWEFDTSVLTAITVADQGSVGGEGIAPGTFTFYPSIAVNSDGAMAIGFSASAPTTFAGAYYAGRVANDLPGTVGPSQVLRRGLDTYVRTHDGTRNRWGDYSGMAVDPMDDSTFWVFNEYASLRGTVQGGEDGRWATAYKKFTVERICGDPTRDSSVNIMDAIFTLKASEGSVEPSPIAEHLGNVVRDGEINEADAERIVESIVGLSDISDCGLPNEFQINIGDTVSEGSHGPGAGAIEVSATEDIYTFTANAGQMVSFDEQGASGPGIIWTVEDEDATVIVAPNDLNDTDPGERTLERGGTYTITVFGEGSSTGTYQFQINDVPEPP